MIRPTTRCAVVAAAGLVPAALPAVAGADMWPAWIAAAGGLLVLMLVDALAVPASWRITSEVTPPPQLYIGESDPLRIRLETVSPSFDLRARMVVDLDPTLAPQPERDVSVARGAPLETTLPLLPSRRGMVRLATLWLRWTGPLGLMGRSVRRPLDLEVPVIPNIRAVKAAAIRLFMRNDFMSGLKVERYVGDGSEFDSLREFVPGLDTRAIDWKATARHHRLMSREYRAERNHEVVLAFDTGHRMGEPLEGAPRLDHAINAGLLLAYCSLKTGDRVSLFAFDERVRMHAEVAGGTRSMAAIQRRLAELDYSNGETNFTLGLTDLSMRLRRRALVVVLTEFADTVTAELMIENLDRLARRHIVVFACLKDTELSSLSGAAPADDLDVSRAVVAADLERDREVVLRRLARSGILCVDAPPHALSAALVDRYLEVKRRELI